VISKAWGTRGGKRYSRKKYRQKSINRGKKKSHDRHEETKSSGRITCGGAEKRAQKGKPGEEKRKGRKDDAGKGGRKTK